MCADNPHDYPSVVAPGSFRSNTTTSAAATRWTWGRIVNISSVGARIGSGSVSVAYGASKAGLEGLTRSYAMRLAPAGVTVNAVAPGLIDTEMGKPLVEAVVATRIPVGRAGTGDEIAQAVILLASNGYMTGQTIAVNGGTLFS